MMELEQLRKRLIPAGQEHILKYWDDLDSDAQKELGHQINSIQFEEVNEYFQ